MFSYTQYTCMLSYAIYFFAGRESFFAEEWRHTRHWMHEALRKSIEDEEQAKDVDIVSIYDHLAFAEYKVTTNDCVYISDCSSN